MLLTIVIYAAMFFDICCVLWNSISSLMMSKRLLFLALYTEMKQHSYVNEPAVCSRHLWLLPHVLSKSLSENCLGEACSLGKAEKGDQGSTV